MKITGAFLNSKVAQRIAILLFIAAVIPTMLMTLLSSNKVNQTINNYEHRLLLEKTRNYALQTLSNLVYARNHLQHLVNNQKQHEMLENSTFNFADKSFNMFESVIEVTQDQLNHSTKHDLNIDDNILTLASKIQIDKVTILAIPNNKGLPTIYLGLINKNQQNQGHYIIAEVSPNYLWGKKNEYPSNLQVCAHQILDDVKQTLFCSNEQVMNNNDTQNEAINHAEWELFLNGEFASHPWVFDITRTQPISKNHLKEIVGSRAFISIAIGSLLAVGLLSLIQIRRTMNPLERLLMGTKKIQDGDFSPVSIEGSSEFSALANALNGMSAHIKRQLETMQSFSAIDKEIVSSNDVQQVIQLVLNRMKTIAPTQQFCIAEIKEQATYEAQCNCTLLNDGIPLGIRLAIHTKDLTAISQYHQGLFKSINMASVMSHERLMAEYGANHLWTLPIFWQGQLYGFICVGSENALNQQDTCWQEYIELANRIGTAIASHAREQQLLLEAQYDSLTGLPNRILLRDRLKQAMEHSDKTGKAMWVVFIDLDRFKVINDSLGHAVGDNILKETANRLLAQTRETDTVARFGGDEFVLVLSGDAGENIQISVLQRMMDAIAEPIYLQQQVFINTCSIGIAVYPDDGKNAELLIKNADIAMYRAKELGRNNHQFFTQSLNDKAAKRMKMISQLRKAIEQQAFHLAYQPKVDIRSGNIVGLEALIRWDLPEGGFVSPQEFIPVAEESGLINAIGEWVLKEVCQQTAIWFKSGFKSLLVSVNLSAKQFESPELISQLQSILIETGTKASSIELELTETALMHISDTTIKTLHDIKSLGIELSIDDFGTGYSNLSYLNNLPMDSLKIDKAFVDTITLKTDKSPIVDTIISLAKNMGLKVVAEGVETVEQLDYLSAQDCDQMQGYYFSKPVSAEEITSMLHANKRLQTKRED